MEGEDSEVLPGDFEGEREEREGEREKENRCSREGRAKNKSEEKFLATSLSLDRRGAFLSSSLSLFSLLSFVLSKSSHTLASPLLQGSSPLLCPCLTLPQREEKRARRGDGQRERNDDERAAASSSFVVVVVLEVAGLDRGARPASLASGPGLLRADAAGA